MLNYCWSFIECYLPKIPTYMCINSQEIFPPIRLFSPIFLLVSEEISHLYFYSDSSSIRNSRVVLEPWHELLGPI